MRKKSKCIHKVVILLMGVFSWGFTFNDTVWERISSGISENIINCITVHPQDNDLIFAGTPKALYRSTDKGRTYSLALQLQSSMKGINAIYIGSPDQEKIYAATDSGLFISYDRGDHWKNIYASKDPQSRRCFAVIADRDFLYLGTLNGLFYKSINTPLWHRQEGALGNTAIYDLSGDRDYIYIATDSRLDRLDKKRREIKQIFTLGRKVDNGEGEFVDDQDDPFFLRKIKDLIVLNRFLIYLATDKGIFHSADQGETWERLFSHGLTLGDTTSLTVSDNTIFAGTTRGVYRYENNKWLPLYKGMETNTIRFLTHDGFGVVYAATDKGIFSTNAMPPTKGYPPTYARIMEQFHNEPSILDVQDFAIDYAEVSPEKIKRWRTAARTKAILPDLSVGIDRAATDLFHWDSGANPDRLQKGRDYLDWDVSLSWDLADFIWSTAQTTIDSRSKLMVELREDILGQITRLYFERRRVQVELMGIAEVEPKIMIEKEMRIQELTALIDALTGSEFSRRIARNKAGQ